jgi:hypothetical protein
MADRLSVTATPHANLVDLTTISLGRRERTSPQIGCLRTIKMTNDKFISAVAVLRERGASLDSGVLKEAKFGS